MSSQISRDQFNSTLNQEYTIDNDNNGSIQVELVQVTDLKESGPYQSFSLIFEGALTDVVPQKIRKVGNANLGEMEIFVCPVTLAETQEGKVNYQAVFSRQKSGS